MTHDDDDARARKRRQKQKARERTARALIDDASQLEPQPEEPQPEQPHRSERERVASAEALLELLPDKSTTNDW